MDSDKRMPPDVPRGRSETQDEIERAASGVAERASDLANRTVDSVKGSYERAREKVAEIDPRESLRDAGRYVQETGEAAVETVERHPMAAFALGAISVGLLAWAMTGRRSSSWQPDTSNWTRTLRDYGDEALRAGRELVGSGRKQLDQSSDYVARGRDYVDTGRDYAREGGRMLMQRSEREPLAAVLGVGIALYVLGSLFASSAPQPAKRRPAAKR
ncbi:hypothetical protein [Bosea sp. (in: a-proteobacteria)]|jgi:hypothetical protein|uniref:hypothetical protein n=1 Tax=Bosea sp. (in: a-proteobacteria) TaxID=1871050 RepID=UPI002FC6358E